jgi:hypothetical protein
VNILDVINDENLLGRFFKDKSTWLNWLIVFKGIFGLPMAKWEFARWTKLTGRTYQALRQFQEIFLLIGRRGGKSFMTSILAVFRAFFFDYTPYLSSGETATILIVATDQIQAKIVLRYIKGIINAVPLFRAKLVRERAMDLELSNRVQIMIRTASIASVRGYTLACVILEEASFWQVDGQNPGDEILRAVRPGLSTIPGSMLLAISSAYSRSGIMFEAHRDHYGRDESDVLVVSASTREMNPTISQKYIDKELAKDPTGARAEWLSEFRTDVSGHLPWAWIEASVVVGRFEIGPQPNIAYSAFADPSGGSGDSFAASIGHREGERLVQDVAFAARPPFNPHEVTKQICELLKKYRVENIKGDRYSARWVADAFESHGIHYVQSRRTKSDLYLELAPLLAQGRCELLDNKVQAAELRSLERKTGMSGKDSVNHPPKGHDDSANALAGLMVNLAEPASTFNYMFVDPNNPFPDIDPASGFVDGERIPMLRATASRKPVECRMNACNEQAMEGGEYCYRCQEEVDRRLRR